MYRTGRSSSLNTIAQVKFSSLKYKDWQRRLLSPHLVGGYAFDLCACRYALASFSGLHAQLLSLAVQKAGLPWPHFCTASDKSWAWRPGNEARYALHYVNLQMTPWLTSVGFSLCFGTIMAKMARIFYTSCKHKSGGKRVRMYLFRPNCESIAEC